MGRITRLFEVAQLICGWPVSGHIPRCMRPQVPEGIDGRRKSLFLGSEQRSMAPYGETRRLLKRLVANGITTVRDMGAPLADIVRLRDAIAAGRLLGPRLFIAGPVMEGQFRSKWD